MRGRPGVCPMIEASVIYKREEVGKEKLNPPQANSYQAHSEINTVKRLGP
ncbi:MAG: hypothetical protein SVY53_02785 [Chloroflexota bacterium]|nr:hypothetical protein [Chloroflexota bacterium]